jgi:hypothetical protein
MSPPNFYPAYLSIEGLAPIFPIAPKLSAADVRHPQPCPNGIKDKKIGGVAENGLAMCQ